MGASQKHDGGGIRRHRSGSLYERLRMDDQQTSEPSGDEISDRVRSIKGNLVRVLNARAGAALSCPLYGLDDLNDANVGTADMLSRIATQIRKMIAVFEPRVQNVNVHFAREHNRETELFFTISAETRIAQNQEAVVIDMVLQDGKRFRVRE